MFHVAYKLYLIRDLIYKIRYPKNYIIYESCSELFEKASFHLKAKYLGGKIFAQIFLKMFPTVKFMKISLLN